MMKLTMRKYILVNTLLCEGLLYRIKETMKQAASVSYFGMDCMCKMGLRQ